ncbi:carbohydrate ABC transporter permease [Chelatococcus sp. SYSU_G07232]|uniref:Carbohydrate ABC transporter permease n=1 Tax=Chelatococcus albus TaxID=3047466 RepID=A0ABT7AKY5_9HYPH|nr:carbohydrate ABC transporter permease [Chelatococcus sp. SYSU_G07232]MDJ1160035.1 carbohydrate ABC transporter permease [Chelatococcus sp. SYSU_G07232]
MTRAATRPSAAVPRHRSQARAAPRPGRILAVTLLALGGIVMVMPFVYMLATSLKDNSEIFELSLWPRHPTLDNYAQVLGASGFPRWFFNSLLVAAVTTGSVLFFDSLVGYTLAKFRFCGRPAVFVAILSTLMVPTEMLVLPWYTMSKAMGWLDTYWGLLFPGLMTGFGTFLMKQFFESVPDELIEAGRIDGLNEFEIWWRICLPLVGPALSALAIFVFLGNWTAFLWPLIAVADTRMYTLPVGLASFSSELQTEWGLIMAGAAVATMPTLVVFVLLQKYIVRGIMLAGLKV